jgi:hypothetical protein
MRLRQTVFQLLQLPGSLEIERQGRKFDGGNMLQFDSAWRYESPGAMPTEVVDEVFVLGGCFRVS